MISSLELLNVSNSLGYMLIISIVIDATKLYVCSHVWVLYCSNMFHTKEPSPYSHLHNRYHSTVKTFQSELVCHKLMISLEKVALSCRCIAKFCPPD